MTDISTIGAHDREVELEHPGTEKGLGWFFSLRSLYSEEVRKADRDIQSKRLAQMSRGRKGQTITPEQIEDSTEKKILASVSGWKFEGDASFNGEKPEFSASKLREIIRDPRHAWIREFLDREIGDLDSFFRQ